MSICIRWSERPNGVVGKAYDRAMDIVGGWQDKPEHHDIARLMFGWPNAALCERVAYALLEASGYREDLLEAAIDGAYETGQTAADLDEELERTRKR